MPRSRKIRRRYGIASFPADSHISGCTDRPRSGNPECRSPWKRPRRRKRRSAAPHPPIAAGFHISWITPPSQALFPVFLYLPLAFLPVPSFPSVLPVPFQQRHSLPMSFPSLRAAFWVPPQPPEPLPAFP